MTVDHKAAAKAESFSLGDNNDSIQRDDEGKKEGDNLTFAPASER